MSGPVAGTLSGTAPNLTYTSAIGFSGTDNLVFKVSDGNSVSADATITISVSGPTSVPAGPSSLSATAAATSGTIYLAWRDSANNEDGFKIERSSDNRTWTQVAVIGPGVTNYMNGGLARNKTFYFRVRSFNILGNSVYSNTASARTK